jgi:hypothetical protein
MVGYICYHGKELCDNEKWETERDPVLCDSCWCRVGMYYLIPSVLLRTASLSGPSLRLNVPFT